MAYEVPGRTVTKLAAADLRSHQYRFMVLNSSGRAAVPGAGNRVFGVLQNAPNSGEAATIMEEGISKVVASAAIAAGAAVATTNDGRAVTAATGNNVAGQAQTAAGGAGEIIAVQIQVGGIVP